MKADRINEIASMSKTDRKAGNLPLGDFEKREGTEIGTIAV
jgi:hypothetical protein